MFIFFLLIMMTIPHNTDKFWKMWLGSFLTQTFAVSMMLGSFLFVHYLTA